MQLKLRKLAAGIAMAGTVATGGTVATDRAINPYDTVGSTLEISATSALAESGTIRIIADKTQPKVTFEKWNGEVALGMTYQGITSTGDRPFLSKNVTWSEDTQKMEAVPLDPSPEHEDGGMAINIILDTNPVSNIFNFTIDNAQNLDFFYQAPLWHESGLPAPTDTCTDTDCTTEIGTMHRPGNIVGSYAVYYHEHGNHAEGETNYGSGKAYHIYRPLVEDAKGNSVWADLSIVGDLLTVTVPQDFLDTAVYPVKIDPDIGYTSIGGTSESWATANALRSPTSYTGAPGTLTEAVRYGSCSGPGHHTQIGVYKSSDNSKVDATGDILLPNSGTESWQPGSLVGAAISSIGYYIWHNDDSTCRHYADATGSGFSRYRAQTYNVWPATLTDTTNNANNQQLSIYFSYIASPAFDASTTVQSLGFAAGNTYTGTHVATSLANTVILMCAQLWQDVAGSGTISAASYNGVALTLATTSQQASMRVEIWYLIAPASGSNTTSATVSGNTDDRRFLWSTWYNANQTNPIDGLGYAQSATGALSGSMTTATANDMLVDCNSRFGTQTLTRGAGQQLLASSTLGSTAAAMSYQATTTVGTARMSWTTTGTNDWAWSGVALRAPSAGVATPSLPDDTSFFLEQ